MEYVIRAGRTIVDRGQTEQSNDLTRQIDQLKSTYNNLGAKVTKAMLVLNDRPWEIVRLGICRENATR